MTQIFSVSDIHGELTLFERLLKYWNADNEQLIIMGDLIDRGEDSYGVIKLALKLQQEYGAIGLTGNHEEMFLSWMNNPASETSLYYSQGGKRTIQSFFSNSIIGTTTPTQIRDLLLVQFREEIHFLKELKLYYEDHSYVFVHAGVNLDLQNWKESDESDFTWAREEFHNGRNNTGKTFIFGHTPTRYLHQDKKSDDIWISACKSKLGVDGGATFGGALHGLVVDTRNQTYKNFTITK